MNMSESKFVEETLQKREIHQDWDRAYHITENQKFYNQAFDYLADVLNAPKNAIFLDVGCGTCAHSKQLARRGFSVVAVDCSESALEMAQLSLQDSELQMRIKLQRENILSLSFTDETFDYALCWGVLMHIPDVERAISELARVLKKGGVLVISEANMFSLQALAVRWLKKLLRKEKSNVRRTDAGLEHWGMTTSGQLLTRQANIHWLTNKFKANGFIVKTRVSGQFTELYTRMPLTVPRKLIHFFNHVWFKYIKIPQPAFGNIIIVQKER